MAHGIHGNLVSWQRVGASALIPHFIRNPLVEPPPVDSPDLKSAIVRHLNTLGSLTRIYPTKRLFSRLAWGRQCPACRLPSLDSAPEISFALLLHLPARLQRHREKRRTGELLTQKGEPFPRRLPRHWQGCGSERRSERLCL